VTVRLPAQRIAFADRLDVDHLACLAMEQHGGEADHACAGQPAFARDIGEGLGDVVAGVQAQVAAQHFRRAAGQRERDPVDQRTHCGHHRHAEHQRSEDGEQVSGKEFAAQGARGMFDHVHADTPAALSTRRPPSSR
jgi:hypothetical protein